MKYILRQRRHVYDGIKEVYLFLDKHVKSEKGHVLWYIHSIGEWETCQKKTATMDPILFGITTKKNITLIAVPA